MHSSNLASFVFLYKAMLALMRVLEGKSNHIHPAIAGFVGGYLIWGENNKVNSQVREVDSAFDCHQWCSDVRE